MRRLSCVLLAALGLAAGACTTGGGSGGEGSDAPAIVARPPTPESAEGPAPTPVMEGRAEDKYVLEVEMCFNRYELYVEQLDQYQELITVVDCRRPHDGEVYASHFHPAEAGAPYPGTAEIERWSNTECYGSFEEFVGTPYELSALEIGSIRPVAEFWEDPARVHREVICYVFAPDAQLSGPMGASEF